MWNIGIFTDEVSHDFEQALDLIKAWGLKYVEIRTVDRTNFADLSEEGMQRVKKLVDVRDLKVAALGSPFLKCYLHEPKAGPAGDAFFSKANTYPEHLEILKRCSIAGKMWDTRITRCFSFWREENMTAVWGEIVERLQHSAKLAQEYGLVLAMENETSCNGGTPDEVRRLMEDVSSPTLGVMWDAGNAQWAGIPAYPDGYNSVKGHIYHVHVKDIAFAGDGSPHGTVFGEGVVNFRDMFIAMANDGYQGNLSLEPHFKAGEPGSNDKVQACVDNLRRLLDELGIAYQ